MGAHRKLKNGNSESEDMRLLKECLGQYYCSRMRRKQLERRLEEIRHEMNAPIGEIHYGSRGNKSISHRNPGAAGLVFRKAGYESRIQEQREEAEKALLMVMDILDYLEPYSDERMILELRYIDNREWNDIADEMCMSRSACFYKKEFGLKRLLGIDGVRDILRAYQS